MIFISVKVLFIGMTPNPGGLETYMINIFSKLQGRGFSFSFVNLFNKKIAYYKYIKKNSGQVYYVPMKKGLMKYFTRYSLAKHFFHKHHDYDIVHINALSVNEVYWAKAAHRYGIKHIIFQSHNSAVIYKSKIISLFGHILSYYNKRYLRNSNINKLAASVKCGQLMFDGRNKFDVIPNGIDTQYFYPNYYYRNILRNKLGINRNDKVLITTARLNKQKNYPKIINTFKYVHKLDHSARLVIIGSGVEKDYLERMVDSFALSPYVYFLGMKSRSSIAKLLNIADIMIMPSFFEAVPFSLTEAQAEGIPSLVSLEGLPREANITGAVRYLSLRCSDYLWAINIIKILNHYSYNFKLREKMNQLVSNSDYNLDNSIWKIKNYYLSMLSKWGSIYES